MKTTHILFIAAAGCILAACGQKTQPVFPDEKEAVLYSRTMIDARMSAWYNKDAQVGFPNANSTNGIVQPEAAATWDYVPGVVAKGILDVWSLYRDSAWADAWYEGLAAWAESDACVAHAAQMMKGGILDDLNCAKVYLGLYEGAKPGGKYENAERAAFYMEQMRLAAKGLEEHKALYSIKCEVPSDQVPSTKEDSYEPEINGGWMHKATGDPTQSYWGQMWCDGAYMGPALLAQLIAAGATEGLNLGWEDVVKQFTASWPYLWDKEKRLLYHVLFTDVTVNKNGKAIYEAGHLYEVQRDDGQCTKVYHSEEFWGRADGWYIMAIVDVLEAMDKAQYRGAGYDTLRGYLTELADGLVARQDKETGCWYQLLQYGTDKCATQGVDETGSPKYTNVAEGGTQCNYLESSGSCLITAALLKGTRLGYLNHADAGKRGFEGIVKQFVNHHSINSSLGGTAASLNITSSCQSAGLSKDRLGNAAYYLIGKDVPIQDNTEGKVLGAFLMAAAEYERLCTNSVNL